MQILTSRVGTNFLLNDTQSRLLKTYWDGLNLDIREQDDELLPSLEGQIQLRLHKVRERDSKLRNKAVESFIREKGGVFCEVCKFSFEDKYGTLGKGFIEVHHLKPISEYEEGDVTSIENLKLVCSNCHRMIHRGDSYSTFYSLQERFL